MLWTDTGRTYGLFRLQVSVVFKEVGESFIEKFDYVIELRGGILQDTEMMYAEKIRDREVTLRNCVRFLDCSNILICRPGGHGSLQRACFGGHKQNCCLKYIKMTKPDGLMFALFDVEAGRWHDVTLL